MRSKAFSLLLLVLVFAIAPGSSDTALAAPFGGVITGTVTSPSGYPLPDGTVVKIFQPGVDVVFGQANANSSTGTFSLGLLPNGLYILKAVPPTSSGLTQSLPTSVAILNAPADAGILALTTPQITGLVTAPDGLTGVTATVRVLTAGGRLFQSVPAPGGSYAVGGLPTGTFVMMAKPGTDDPYWDSMPVNVTVGAGSQVVDLSLTAANLWGYARDTFGNPVANARVSAYGQASPFLRRTDYSRASGFWSLGGLSSGNYNLILEPPETDGGLVPPAPQSVTIPGAPNPITLTFGAPPKLLSGVVKTNANEPVNRAPVRARRVDRPGQVSALTGADGSYQLHLAPGLWAVTVEPASGTSPADWIYPQPPQFVYFQDNLTPEAKTLNMTVLTADSQVNGTVKMPDGSTPPFVVTVALRNSEGLGRQVDTGAGGAFSVHIPNGSYKVDIVPHDLGYLGPAVDPIIVPPSSTYNLGTLTLLARDAAIAGTVADGSGAGVEGISVVAWRAGVPKAVETQTDSAGRYVLGVSAGTWHVQPAPGPSDPYVYTGSGQDVVIAAAQTIDHVDLTLTAANATIHGQLVNATSQPVSNAAGWAEAAASGNPAVHKGAPILAGRFDIFVPGGTYNVAAHLPAGSPYMSSDIKNVTVAARGEVTITLQVQTENAAITGALWDPRASAAVPGVNGMVAVWADHSWAATNINPGNGTFRLDVAANLWHLGYRIAPNAGYVKLVEGKNVPVQAGQTVPVNLPVLPKDGTISGTVLGVDGNPLRGAIVFANGIGPVVEDIWLKTSSQADGTFSLAVPHGLYRLGAALPSTTVIQPAQQLVDVPGNGTSGGHVLQFKTPDATLSGNLTVSTAGQNGKAVVWAWSKEGGTARAQFPITNSAGAYSLNVQSNTTWSMGAAFETSTQYWFGRGVVTLGAGNGTKNITLNGPYPKPAPVVVTFDASQSELISLADGTTIYIPAGALPATGWVTLRVVPVATLPNQQHANVFKYGYAFLATDGAGEPIEASFNQDVVISFTYNKTDLAAWGFSEGALKPAYFSTTTNQWTFPDSYVVDTGANRVTMQIDHFTDFALTSSQPVQIYLPLIGK